MIKIVLHFFGKKPSIHQSQILENYLKRIPKSYALNVILHNKLAHKDTATQLAKELTFLTMQTQSGGTHILLDEGGQTLSSREFENFIQKKLQSGILNFYVGGANGFHHEVDKLNLLKISISSFTLPHEIARLILVEQIYRAYTLSVGHPYHNE